MKQLNSRSMKSIKQVAAVCLSLLLTINLIILPLLRARAEVHDPGRVPSTISPPALQGAAAIVHLKDRGIYNSLRGELSAARSGRGDYSIIAPPMIDEQKLTASDGAANDVFGGSVAVSGSTAVVGAIGANSFQGAAYVFERHGGSCMSGTPRSGSAAR
jgi:hypothetical protein